MENNKATKKSVKKDIGYYGTFVALLNTEGGQNYVKLLKRDLVSAIDHLCATYATSTQNELVASISLLRVRLETYRLFQNAPVNQEDAEKELALLLESDPEPPEEKQ